MYNEEDLRKAERREAFALMKSHLASEPSDALTLA